MNERNGKTVGEAEHKAGIVKYDKKTSMIRKENQMRDELENHEAQVLLRLANIISKSYITVNTETVDGWHEKLPVLTIRKIQKKLIPKLKSLDFKFNGFEDCLHPEFSAFLNSLYKLNFVRVQCEHLHLLPAGYDIDKLEVKLAHPLFTEECVDNIIQHIQKNPKWDANDMVICKPFPKKEDVIKKITSSLYIEGSYGPCRVHGCPSINRGGPCKGFCSAHYNIHGNKFERKKPWGRIGE